jgi:hypothetical protein
MGTGFASSYYHEFAGSGSGWLNHLLYQHKHAGKPH